MVPPFAVSGRGGALCPPFFAPPPFLLNRRPPPFPYLSPCVCVFFFSGGAGCGSRVLKPTSLVQRFIPSPQTVTRPTSYPLISSILEASHLNRFSSPGVIPEWRTTSLFRHEATILYWKTVSTHDLAYPPPLGEPKPSLRRTPNALWLPFFASLRVDFLREMFHFGFPSERPPACLRSPSPKKGKSFFFFPLMFHPFLPA